VVHGVLHPPQFFASVSVFVQPPAQHSQDGPFARSQSSSPRPAPQAALAPLQTPCSQVCVPGQTTMQEPQFFGSFARSAQLWGESNASVSEQQTPTAVPTAQYCSGNTAGQLGVAHELPRSGSW
jgi:hypothetical protein